ncbi:leucine-rich repeat protein [Fulvivirgaceae bacterium BMA12]|uniref:Leucine-rich repeat protein n=1 Tax=Agaribacillus aureus TaxID=3051825 RepID=A0ABT8LB64_9BACT|nr:leucine-rich repeat protein [Fulvivirgaceae bacterium BMA12]
MKNLKPLKLIMPAIFMVLTSLTSYGQLEEVSTDRGKQFTVDNILYEITTGRQIQKNDTLWFLPGKVEVVQYSGVAEEVTIPSKVNYQGIDYTVTSIRSRAFFDAELPGVYIPHTVTSIGDRAFQNNKLTEVVIPFRVNTIGASAFENAFENNQNVKTVIVRKSHPPQLGTNAFQNPGRGQIGLLVPAGTSQAYNVWNGFSSIDPGTFTDTDDGITYAITSISQNEVEIADYDTNSGKEVTIPETVDHGTNTYTVTAIGYRAFYNKQLTKLIFSDQSNVTHIREDAFFGSDPGNNILPNKLDSVVIPESVTHLGQRAFGSSGLVEVNIPSGVTKIERWTFALNDLKELTIPANVEYIDFQGFYRNQNLPKVTVERNPPTALQGRAFELAGYWLSNIGGMDLVVPFDEIQAYKDAGWTVSEFGTITSGITTVDKVKYGIIDSRNEATLITHIGVGHNLIIPSEVDIDGNTYPVTAIGDSAFVSTERALLTVIIPESVKSIGEKAFYVRKINHIIMMSDEPPALDSAAFEYPYRNEIDLIVPEGREQAYRDAGWTGFKDIFSLKGRLHLGERGFLWEVTSLIPNEVSLLDYRGPRVDTLEIPSEIDYLSNSELDKTYTVTSIGYETFKGKRWTSVLIPNTVDSIAVSAFYDNQLTSIAIPDAVTYIGEYAFGKNKLTSIEIPERVTKIGGSAFRDNQLTSVKIPDSVTDIGEYAFAQNQLTSVTTPGNVKRIRRWTYASNQLTEVTISDSVTNIDLFAFEDNPNLRLVTVKPIDPPSLNENAFSNAYRDQIDLVVPMSDTSIQVYLDHGWDGFRSISFGIFTVDDIRYAITSRTEVMVVDYTGTATEVTIPETVDHGTNTYTVTTIGEGAFQNKQLANVEIPVSVTSIWQKAFMDNQLTVVTIPANVDSIGFHAFYNNPDLGLVTVGANNPPALDATAFANANRHQIVLVVPTGRIQAYEDNGWDGFKSISNGSPPPQPTIHAIQSVDNLEPSTINITFDDEVTGFELRDIQVTNATVTNFTGSGSIYSATIVPTLCDDITIDVPANVAIGTHSLLPNLAATQIIVAVDRKIACSAGVPSFSLMIPTAFTPNGDGANDAWIIDNLSKDASVRIYDRHGTVIFSSNDGYTRPWDGTSRGHSLPAGSYLYLIQNGPHTYRGSVTILL